MAKTDDTHILTETEIRSIAREESMKVLSGITSEISAIKKVSNQNKEILGRLERLLLGEEGMDENDTMKWKINYAYRYAKKNTDIEIVKRSVPAIEWFEDMNTPDKGCKDSKLEILGKIVTAYSSLKWVAGFFGVVSVSTFIGLILLLWQFVKLVKELGI